MFQRYLNKVNFGLTVLIAAMATEAGARAESIGFSVNDNTPTPSVLVLDDVTGAPINDASISLENPLSSNSILTVTREGYASTTLIGAQGKNITIYLKPLLETQNDIEASGNVGGWRENPQSRPVYLGLVFKTSSIFDLLHFNTDSVVSPLKDTIDIWGDREIPSNLVLPEQNIPIFIGSAHVNKTNYRLPIVPRTESRLMVAHAEMSADDLIAVGRGGLSLDAVNKLTFTRIGLGTPVRPDSNFQQNIDAGIELTPKHQVTVSVPPFEADVLVAAVTDLDGDRYTLIPTDIRMALKAGSKRPEPVYIKGTVTPFGKTQNVVSFAMAGKGKRLSGIVNPQAGPTVKPGGFLMADDLKDFTQLPFSIKLRKANQGISTAIFEAGVPVGKSKVRTFPIWYVYSLPSAGDVQISPQKLPFGKYQGKIESYSLSYLEFSQSFDEKNFDGQTVMQGLQRFARSQASKPAPKNMRMDWITPPLLDLEE